MWPSSACRWTTRLLRRLKTAATTSVLPSRKSAAACSKSSRGHTAAALPQPNTSECGPRGFSIRDLEPQEIAAIHCVGDLAHVDRLALSVSDMAAFRRVRAGGPPSHGDFRSASGGNRMGDIRPASLHTRRTTLTLVAAMPLWSQSRKSIQSGGETMGQPVVHFEIGCRDHARDGALFW
jgi:hypothetical protein